MHCHRKLPKYTSSCFSTPLPRFYAIPFLTYFLTAFNSVTVIMQTCFGTRSSSTFQACDDFTRTTKLGYVCFYKPPNTMVSGRARIIPHSGVLVLLCTRYCLVAQLLRRCIVFRTQSAHHVFACRVFATADLHISTTHGRLHHKSGIDIGARIIRDVGYDDGNVITCRIAYQFASAM